MDINYINNTLTICYNCAIITIIQKKLANYTDLMSIVASNDRVSGMRIFALNGNMFGPNTSYGDPGSLYAAQCLVGVSFRPLLEIRKIDTYKWSLLNGDEISVEQIEACDAYVTNKDEIDFTEEKVFSNYFLHRFISRRSIVFKDLHDGGVYSSIDVATNFPFLMNDYFNSRIFQTKGLDPVRKYSLLSNKTYSTVNNQTLMCFENVIFESCNEPLYTYDGVIEQTAEFYQSIRIYGGREIPHNVYDDPILYLNFSGSYNYNIFVHEHLPVALILENLPDNTKIMIGPEKYKQEFLIKLGVDPCRLYINNDSKVLLSKVFVPMRQLNLKSVNFNLLQAYEKIRNNIKSEIKLNNKSKNNSIFLGRENDNKNSGVNRFITNQSEIDNYISSEAKFDIIYAEKLNLEEKYHKLSNSNIIISPMGANLVNLALCENVKCIIIITSPVWWHFKKYWQCLLQALHPTAKIVIFEYCEIIDNNMSQDQFNKPFSVDVDKLKSLVDSLVLS